MCSLDLYHDIFGSEAARAQAERLLETCPQNRPVLIKVTDYYDSHGEAARARELVDGLTTQRDAEIYPLTRTSYGQLQRQLAERGILLVAIQYPRRPLAQLRRHLVSTDGVVLVDNEARFEEAVAEYGYDTIFVDSCYGDFGHATPQGNLILAEQVAEVVLEALPQVTGKRSSRP